MALYPLYVPTSCRIQPRAERGIRTFERQGQDLFSVAALGTGHVLKGGSYAWLGGLGSAVSATICDEVPQRW